VRSRRGVRHQLWAVRVSPSENALQNLAEFDGPNEIGRVSYVPKRRDYSWVMTGRLPVRDGYEATREAALHALARSYRIG
jgi:hypothetical protein